MPDPGWIQEALALKEIPKEGPNLQERNPQKMIAKERPETCQELKKTLDICSKQPES